MQSQQSDPIRNDPDALWRALRDCVKSEDQADVAQALDLARQVHAGQRRKSEEPQPIPYIVHPLRVARVVAEEWGCNDRASLLAGLLHDALEDCAPQSACRQSLAEEIGARFGQEIHDAVWKLTKPTPAPAEVRPVRDARYFSELRSAPEWVRRVKCADRLDNLRDALAWGDVDFWVRYSSETIGWHLFLARETSPLAEVALFKALVEGERAIRGRVPVWADGYLIDPSAAELVPEHMARLHRVIGIALQGEILYVGVCDPDDPQPIRDVALVTRRTVQAVRISEEAVSDALSAGMYGHVEATHD